jgi:hypothetical protein
MTDARIERVPADRVTAREFLAQGPVFLDDARSHLSNGSRQILLHQAAICACDAVLLAKGLRVSSGDRAHILRFERALDELPGPTDELLEALDAARAMRVDASYQAMPVASASVDDAAEATRELYARTEELLRG